MSFQLIMKVEHRVSSDISRETFQEIEPLLLSGRKRTRPRIVDVYEVFCALLYILKTGCQWDMLPSDFPQKSTVGSLIFKILIYKTLARLFNTNSLLRCTVVNQLSFS
jgi:transposase